jgi:predicted membrane protein
MQFVEGPLVVPFFILQFGIGSVLPLAVITFLIWRGSSGTALIVGVTGSAILVLLAVLMMRYNVVIGGQEISKTARGLIAYHPPIFGREGLAAAAMVLAIPMILLLVMVRLFPPWEEAAA